MQELTCPKCQETRLVHRIDDARGQQAFCQVCSHAWWIRGPLADAVVREGRGYRPKELFDVSGNLIDGE